MIIYEVLLKLFLFLFEDYLVYFHECFHHTILCIYQMAMKTDTSMSQNINVWKVIYHTFSLYCIFMPLSTSTVAKGTWIFNDTSQTVTLYVAPKWTHSFDVSINSYKIIFLHFYFRRTVRTIFIGLLWKWIYHFNEIHVLLIWKIMFQQLSKHNIIEKNINKVPNRNINHNKHEVKHTRKEDEKKNAQVSTSC